MGGWAAIRLPRWAGACGARFTQAARWQFPIAIASSMNLADRMGRLGTETAFEVLARARALEAQGRTIIHLEIGEPDFDTPANVIEAATRALRNGETHYGPAAGLPVLREAIANHVNKTRGSRVTADQVLV